MDDTKIKIDKDYVEGNFHKPAPRKPAATGAKEVAAKPAAPEKINLLD